ncbi:MAG TPA: T9SS type A sorting domain-containing protein [Crocinitomicaceae bacterium]|nr:T9SS type A sorting domain-containing protein [Crocinitomicaceae bacterium]
MKKLIASTLLFLIAGSSLFAQEPTKKCASNEAMEEVFQMYPELREHYNAAQLLQNSQVINKTHGTSYVIPVVFHILHTYGNENISDAQVYDAMKIINREFNSADPDSVDVVAEYDTLIGDGMITFKLASIDPLGNCTNGIEHVYSHESNIGDGFSKVQQWNRAKYLNIWVVKTIGLAGAAAYAIKPAGTDGNGFWSDGIVSNHTYVGSIGTSSSFRETTLTHEIGHYLNLSHVWGNTNDPGVACGDDGVLDTPVSMGYSNCLLGAANNGQQCDPLIEEDVQNYMEYSYCSRHFTPGQVEFMHNAIIGIAGERDKLWQDSTLIATGVFNIPNPVDTVQDPSNLLTVPLCVPVADFSSSVSSTCVGSNVAFKDASWNATIDSWSWTFQDGSPATSSSMNPSVSFTSAGYKTVTLTVTNAAGSATETRTGSIYVAGGWAEYNGPKSIDFSSNADAYLFRVENPEDNYAKFQIVNNGGYDNSRAYKLNNYKDVAFAPLFTNDYFYNSRLGGSVDALISPAYDLRYTTGVSISFKYAYATNGTTVADITEQVRVYASKNCGASWVALGGPINGTTLLTGGFAGGTDFTPTSNTQWKEYTRVVNTTSADAHTIFKIEFTASDLSNNLYIDNFNITGTLSLTDDVLNAMDLNVYPNPTTNGQAINVSFNGQDVDVNFTLRNAQGQVLSAETVSATNAAVEHTLENSSNLSAGCYFVEISSGDYRVTRKIVVL